MKHQAGTHHERQRSVAGHSEQVVPSGAFVGRCSLVEERRIQMQHDPPSEGAPLAWDAEATDVWSWDVELHGPLSEEQRARLLEIANKCPVHKTLTSEIDIRTRLV